MATRRSSRRISQIQPTDNEQPRKEADDWGK